MEKSPSVLSPTSLLLCNETITWSDEEIDGVANIDDEEDEDEYIKMLFDREIINGELQLEEFTDRVKMARLNGIHYILSKRVLLGFKSQTAYLAVTYLDRFLSRRSNYADKSWEVMLLSMACLSLAAKMEECAVPVLSEFCVEDYSFKSSNIQLMELLVLNTLEWKLGSITTPFALIHFFMKKLYQDSLSRNYSISRIFEVILGATRDVNILFHKPSVIAAAATLFVMDQSLTRNTLELTISPLASTGALKIEDVSCCYFQVQETENSRIKWEIKDIKSPE